MTSWANLLSGMGQTEFGILDLEQQKLLESEMLTLLGITHVPENAAHKVKRTWSLIGKVFILNLSMNYSQKSGFQSREWQPHHPSLHEGHLPCPNKGTGLAWRDARAPWSWASEVTVTSTISILLSLLATRFIFRNNHFRITELDIKAINDSDVIMSFSNRGLLEELQYTKLFWLDMNCLLINCIVEIECRLMSVFIAGLTQLRYHQHT